MAEGRGAHCLLHEIASSSPQALTAAMFSSMLKNACSNQWQKSALFDYFYGSMNGIRDTAFLLGALTHYYPKHIFFTSKNE